MERNKLPVEKMRLVVAELHWLSDSESTFELALPQRPRK